MYNKLRKFLTKLSQLTGQNLKAREVHIVSLGYYNIWQLAGSRDFRICLEKSE